MAVEYCNIAEPTDPFRIFLEAGEIKLINNAAGAISATACYNGFHAGIIQHFLEVISALFVTTRKIGCTFSDSLPHSYLKAPALQCLHRISNTFIGDKAGRTSNTDRVAGLKGSGN